MSLIGREKEIKILQKCYESEKSEFVVIYGRRRVGKTFLVKELYEPRFSFYVTGILSGNREVQLRAWSNEISRCGGHDIPEADNWIKAFENLNILIERLDERPALYKKKVIFLDEIPWLATVNSDFIAGLDYFWNRWASSRKDILLIICGSAASWITDSIINEKGGLHNRLTRHILLEPFTLHECELYFEERNVKMTRYQIAETYMIFGGIPYYLSLIDPQFSLYQNVDAIYFSQGAELRNEFQNLYNSLFRNSENYIRIVEVLAKKGIGLTRNEIISELRINDGGSLTKILRDLSISGFIREYKAFGQKKRDSLYQLVDFFSLFDNRFRGIRDNHSSDFWLRYSTTSAHAAWKGVSYEKLCLLHLEQIRKKLGISGVLTFAYSWRGNFNGKGAQIDLVIDRNDNVVNLCEIKFTSGLFEIDKTQYEQLRNKSAAFSATTHTRKAVQTTMITTFGLVKNSYASEIVSEVLLDDLFS